MRKVISGAGVDSTVETWNWLLATKDPLYRHLIRIGPAEDPRSIWMTDHEAPLIYTPLAGVFYPGVVSRGMITAKVGLDVGTCDITWSPSRAKQVFTASNATASPLQLARQHIYDNWPVRIWRVYMPTPGDCNTFGATDWYGGRVDYCSPQRGAIVFHTSSFLSVLTQKVPSGVIEVTNTLSGNSPVNLPAGDPTVPQFTCFTGSSTNKIIADCTGPTAGKIYAGNVFAGGYMVFLSGSGATLASAWADIGQNGEFTDGDGNHHSEFVIDGVLPWPPTPSVDKFYVSTTPPTNLGDESYYGFPYVPAPQQQI